MNWAQVVHLEMASSANGRSAFWAARHVEQDTLSFREIMHGEGSPGRVFRLDDTSALDYLEALRDVTGGRLVFEDSALAAQVKRAGEISGEEILRAYYVD